MEKIVQVDTEKIEQEISSLYDQIEHLKSQISIKTQAIEYLKTMGIPVAAPRKAITVKPNPAVPLKIDYAPVQKISLSDFILTSLEEGEKKGKDLVDAYQAITGEDISVLTGRVYNTLSRLKDSKKIVNKIVRGERGGVWEKIKAA